MSKQLFAIVGIAHAAGVEFVRALPHGEPLDLRREPDNPFDQNAVSIYARAKRIGYVRAAQVPPLAAALDCGENFTATLHRSAPERWPLFEIQTRIDPSKKEKKP